MTTTNDAILAGLQPQARNCALRILMKRPGLVLTSGDRDPDSQAHAMAVDLCQVGIDWIAKTYAQSDVRDACIVAVLALHEDSETSFDVAGVTACLVNVFAQFPPAKLLELSAHLGGCAFDIQPLPTDDPDFSAAEADIQAEVTAINAAGGTAKYLSEEGGLIRWHCQVSEPQPTQPS